MEIRFQNLTKIFVDKQKKETVAVDSLDFTIEDGKLIGLLGPSGCGKSTTLFMVAGLHDPTDGRIFFGDDDVTRLSPDKRGIGLVFQNYALYPHMTVQQNIMFPLENLKVPRDEALERTQEMANLVGIGNLLDRKPAQLSGGQQQRVAIARALVKKPRVLLLDEPLSNLDARLRLQMREEIKRIQRETQITTIFVTHDQEEAMSICDQMVIMNFGKEMQRGSPQHIYNHPDNLFVAKFLGNPPINVFLGEIKDNYLYHEGKKVLKKTAPDGLYHVGIRPEDFKISQDGKGVEVPTAEVSVIGRDTMIRFEIGEENEQVRALVESETVQGVDNIVLTVKEDKIHLFDLESEVSLTVIDRYTPEELAEIAEDVKIHSEKLAATKAKEEEQQAGAKKKGGLFSFFRRKRKERKEKEAKEAELEQEEIKEEVQEGIEAEKEAPAEEKIDPEDKKEEKIDKNGE